MPEITAALEAIIESNPRSGTFCATRTTSTQDLTLQVKDFGQLKFPLSERKTKALIKCAKPANFGWRDKTVHDKTVRDVWEINKNKVTIDKRLWNKTLNPLLEQLKSDLGLPENSKLKAELHNLLVYAPGQFFNPHQDSEKLDGMLATLLVVLPSVHSGGSLIIEHQRTKKQFQSSRYALDKLVFCAFYADCHHEVKPVKSGYRVVLSYNLVLANQANQPSPDMNTTDLKNALSDYFSNSTDTDDALSYMKKSPKKMVYLFDHSYTQKGLSWQHLKSVDRLRADALKDSAEALGLELHLALADMQESWQCEDDYDSYDRRHRRYSYYEDDDDEEEDEYESGANAEPIELIEQTLTIRHWLDANGDQLDYQDLDMSTNQLHWTKENDDFEPFETEYEGWMGNYGSTLDRWYHRAAIILWRKRDHFPVMLQMNPEKVIGHMLALAKSKSNHSTLHDIASATLPYWSDHFPRELTATFQNKIFKLALNIGNEKQAKILLQEFNLEVLQLKIVPTVIALSDCYGIDWCIKLFEVWSVKNDFYSTTPLCENIDALLSAFVKAEAVIELCNWLIKYQFATIKKIAKHRVHTIQKIIELLYGCIVVGNDDAYDRIIDEMIEKSKLYPAFILIAVVESFVNAKTKSSPLQLKKQQALCTYVNDTLQAEYDLGLRLPTDWRIKDSTGCNCEDCSVFKKYLRAKTEVEMVWPMGKDRRKHIHGKIDGLGLPITHVTLRQGSPHKLILKKTKELYGRAKKRYTIIGDALDLIQQHELV